MKADKSATAPVTDETGPDRAEAPSDEGTDRATPAEAEGSDAAPATAAEPDPAAEAGELKNKLLRTLAEMENLRRRSERELADARRYAVANFARDVLTVGDNLRRAIETVPAGMRAAGDKALAALLDGIEATERGLEQTLAKFGVRRIDPKGVKFDPAVHQAVYEVETDDIAPGMVAEDIQAGYVIGERVLRPAMVAVAKRPTKPAGDAEAAGPKPAEAEAPPAPADKTAPD
jgi:molecular chaperone GrpE